MMARLRAEGDVLAAQAARLFFDRQMNKVEIAARLGTSRFRVARLIEQALADGLVRIEFRDVAPVDREVARAIEDTWAIDLCVVAAGDPADSAAEGAMAGLAASVLRDVVGPHEVIGIAWGSTLAAVVERLESVREPGVSVVQLAGSSVRTELDQTPGEVARRLALKLGATHHALYAPAFVESRALRDALLRQPDLHHAAELFDRLTLAIVGVGAFGTDARRARSSLLESHVLGETDIARLRAAGAVGDLVLHPFDADGVFIAPELAERAVSISIPQLRRVPRVVAVAGGHDKASAIRGALASGVVDILITDQAAATAIVRSAALERLAARAPRRTQRASRRRRQERTG
jgi:DNA-binding transcriptional regulator LsrR (DeoR family)